MKKILAAALFTLTASAAMAQLTPVTPVSNPAAKPAKAITTPVSRADREVEMAARQLTRFDKNKDGKVTLKEFLEPAQTNFRKFDTNKDGFVTPEELAAAHKLQMDEFMKQRAAMTAANGAKPTPSQALAKAEADKRIVPTATPAPVAPAPQAAK